ncbi:MAG: DUF1697 domain-containing protein [Solirubrobacterales bacterium]|nr:DUF1697 domain-containing protein [Solirubrobacterales bacterium]MCB0859243.1 DUF1697 domain-containing protein [Solirubrobacterales bacterium]HRV59651.1 DUF1697 domain-containing protein [Solirubrobacterales bacterium]
MDGATAYIALLRAVNVGGTGKLPMAELRKLAEEIGFAGVSTYIASGNLLFKSDLTEKQVKKQLEAALKRHTGMTIDVIVRTAREMRAVELANPFKGVAYNRIGVLFLDHPLPRDNIRNTKGRKNEEIELGKREVYIHYPDGMGKSKLNIPAAKYGTSRNLNTVSKLADLAKG